MERINRIYNRLIDQESKDVFDWRFDFSLRNNLYETTEIICKYYDDWKRTEIDEPIVICSAGTEGKITYHICKGLGYEVLCFTDKNYDALIDKINVYSLKETVLYASVDW